MKPSSKRSATSRARPETVTIRRLSVRDRAAWLAMRMALWPDHPAKDLSREMRGLLAREDFAVFGARDARDWCGFVEVGTRDVAEGATSSPVGYVEGLWVERRSRRRGVARRLIGAAADWARSRGLTELGSDTELGNRVSQAAHKRMGFAETERLVTFLLPLR